MKRSRFSEEQIIGILREAEAGSPDKSGLCGAQYQCSSLPCLEEKIWRDGNQRGQEAKGVGRRKLSAQATGGRLSGADSHPERSKRKKVVSPSARRRTVKMSVEEGREKQLRRAGAGTLKVELLLERPIETGEPAHPLGGAGVEREACSLRVSAHHGADAPRRVHDKLRDKCLNRELFGNLEEARYLGKLACRIQ